MNYYELADMYAEEYGLDPAIFRRMIMQESSFNPDAVSPDEAAGLAQIIPSTARQPGYGVDPIGLEERFDPDASLRFGAQYLRAMLDEFGGDYELALAAYNAGPGAVETAGGVPEFRETQEYVQNILGPDAARSMRVDADAARSMRVDANDPAVQDLVEQGVDLPLAVAAIERSRMPETEEAVVEEASARRPSPMGLLSLAGQLGAAPRFPSSLPTTTMRGRGGSGTSAIGRLGARPLA